MEFLKLLESLRTPWLDAFFSFILDITAGKQTKNEIHNYRDISIFKDGVTL